MFYCPECNNDVSTDILELCTHCNKADVSEAIKRSDFTNDAASNEPGEYNWFTKFDEAEEDFESRVDEDTH